LTNFEVCETPGFMGRYIAALLPPHNRMAYSPSVTERLQAGKD
jgi:hypothetical protein